MSRKCDQCGKEFEGKRSTARYCSTRCRVTASRVSVTGSKRNRVSVTDIPSREMVSGVIGEALYFLPALPVDLVIFCNSKVAWVDILKLSKSAVDYVYFEWKKVGGDIFLRLRRAAGYHRRVA